MNIDMQICKINDKRIEGYTKRTRSGCVQIFYTGIDERDFERYRAEGGGVKPNVKMHDKADTIRLTPPEKHYYAELIDGEWWWVNGCAECNGRPRDWSTYIECEKHDVCRNCGKHIEKTKTRWGGKNGWQCCECNKIEADLRKKTALESVASKEYDATDYQNTDKIICPHCESSYEHDCDIPEGDETCEVCGGEYSVKPEYSVAFTTKIKGSRVMA